MEDVELDDSGLQLPDMQRFKSIKTRNNLYVGGGTAGESSSHRLINRVSYRSA